MAVTVSPTRQGVIVGVGPLLQGLSVPETKALMRDLDQALVQAVYKYGAEDGPPAS